MAWSTNQFNNENAATVISFANFRVPGSIIVCGEQNTNASPGADPTDTDGNDYALIATFTDGTTRLHWWWAYNATGTGAGSLTFANTGNLFLAEYVPSPGIVGVLLQNTGLAANHTTATDGITSGNITPGSDVALIVGWTNSNAGNPAAGTGFTQDGIMSTGMTLEHLTQSVSAPIAATFTGVGSGRAQTVVAAFGVQPPPPVIPNAWQPRGIRTSRGTSW